MKRILRSSALLLAAGVCASAQSLVYTKSIAGNRIDSVSAVATDSQGNVYVTGSTNSTNFPRTQNNPAQPAFINLLSSSDSGKTFSPLSIEEPVLALASTPAALIAGTPFGPFRSTDNGITWHSSKVNFPTTSLLTDSRYPARVYAATAQGVLRSDDSGVNWGPSGNTPPSADVLVASAQRPDVLFAVANSNVYRSPDDGQTWMALNLPISPVGPPPAVIAIDPTNPDIVYIAGAYSNTVQQAFIIKSKDGGTTFQQISGQAILTSAQSIAIDSANPASLFAAGIDGKVYHSQDSGATWTATSLAAVTLDGIGFDPNHPGNLYALADQGLYLSTDRGVTWQSTATSVLKRDLRTILFTPHSILLGADQGQHAFLTKWSAQGSLLWSIIVGGSYFDQATAIAVDSNDNPYISGITGSTDFPATSNAFQSGLTGFQNIFLAKFNPDGDQLSYATYLGGSGSDNVSALAIDASGSAYLTGYAVSPDFPTTRNSFQPRHRGSCNGQSAGDAYVAKFSPDASFLAYSTLIGGSCAQISTGIALDAAGHAYISGVTGSSDFPTTKNALQTASGGGTDGFLTELTSAADALVFSTYLGGPSSDAAAGVAVDSSGYIYVAGNGSGFSFAPPPPVSQIQCDGSPQSYGGLPLSVQAPPFFLKLAPGGAAVASHQTFSGCGTVVQALGLDSGGKAWLAGAADNSNFDTVVPFQTLAAGNYFVREYGADAQTTVFSTLIDSFQSLSVGAYTYFGANPVSLSKIDGNAVNAISIDSVQKFGNLSIPALASYSGPIGIAPGELIVLNGRGFPNSATVLFNGIAATPASIGSNRIVCVVPLSLTGTRAQIQIGGSNAVTVAEVPNVVEVIVMVNQDGSINSPANPAAVGSIMTAYVSGLGATPAQVVFDDPATITFQGQAPLLLNGIVQINFVVPEITGQSILSVVDGESTDYVYVYVK